MTWSQALDLVSVGDGTVSSLSVGQDGSPAYRLEIKNLFQDGDFESLTNNSTLTDSWWSASSPTVTLVSSSPLTSVYGGTNSPYSPIENQSLLFSASGAGNELFATLDTTSVPRWGRPGGYRFRFDYRYTATSQTFHASMSGGSIISAENSGLWDVTGLANQDPTQIAFSRFFTIDNSGTPATVTLGSASYKDEAVIDNVRVVHNDIPPYVTMSFPSIKSGSLQLLPGTKPGDYKLAFYVHDDPTADQSGGSGIAHTPNRINPSGITVQVTAAVQSGSSGTYISFFKRPSAGWPKWTPLTFSMGFNFVNSDADIPSGTPALRIEITPTNTVDQSTDGRDAGSVLIAQPTFTYNP
jgi:hypothetical protein